MANKVVISEALNELSKGIKVKPLKEDKFYANGEKMDIIEIDVNDTCLKEIYDNINSGKAYGEPWIKNVRFPFFREVLFVSWDNKYIKWHNYGSGANPNTLEGLAFVIGGIFKMTPKEFISKYECRTPEEEQEIYDLPPNENMLESKKKSNKKALKESVEFASVDYQNLIRDLADRVENPDDEDNIHDAIMDAMDDGLIYNEDLWVAIKEFASPGEILSSLTESGTDIYTYIYEDIYECLHNNLLESKRTLRRKSLREEKFSNKTSQGWTIVKKFKDLDDGRTHVIADRGSGEYPFAVGLGYNEKTGSWGQGMYDYKTAEEAENALKHNNRYHPYNVELIESMIRVPRSEIKKYEATDELNKRLKDYQIAHKTSGIPSAYALGLECVGYSGGSYGCNGHLYRDIETGELLGTTGRDKFIYITENQDDIIEEMSPEDKADSEVLRNVYNKVSRRTDAKVTDKEQKVLDKLGVNVQRKTPNDAYHHKDGDILDKSGDSLSKGVSKTVYNNTSTRTRNRQSSEQGLADANNKINTLLKRK